MGAFQTVEVNGEEVQLKAWPYGKSGEHGSYREGDRVPSLDENKTYAIKLENQSVYLKIKNIRSGSR